MKTNSRLMLQKAIFNKQEEGVVLPYSEAKALTMRNIDEIIEEAKNGLSKIKERNKALKKCADVETLKPGLLKFIESIKQEYTAQHMALGNMIELQETMKTPAPLVDIDPLSARSSISLRSLSIVDKINNIPNAEVESTRRARPQSAPNRRCATACMHIYYILIL
jgi:hypothetical protein